ncbi:hypothetical protein N7540_013038 [Penicillium herquei]|nr:hypothetical protein N7540_013038 [Penicillium herquei]
MSDGHGARYYLTDIGYIWNDWVLIGGTWGKEDDGSGKRKGREKDEKRKRDLVSSVCCFSAMAKLSSARTSVESL